MLILVDLWGGTPFNQANGLIAGHEDTWAIVAGLNLPMLIDAYASRMMMDTAHELAVQISGSAKEGVKIYPESLEPKEEKKVAATSDGQPRGALPEGTVVGDGKIKYVLARIDSRLLHGQVATAWTKTTGPNRIIVVSDGVAHDDLRKSMIREAAPPGVKANVVPVSKMIQVSKDTRFGNTKALLLFETPQDALAAIKGGVDIKELNIGSMAHSVGKVAVSKVLSLDEKDIETFEELKKLGVKFDVRKVPSDSQDNIEGVVDEFQFHQPLVACTLIGLVTGNLEAGIVLGGSLQMIALGWANIGAAVAPDAALASVASAIILVLGGQGVKGVSTAIAVAIPLAVAGLFLTMVVRTLSVACVHRMDAEAEKVNFRGVEMWHIIAICLQGLRIAIPAACLLAIPTETVQNFLQSMPAWLTDGMSIGGGMVVAVGYAMVINMIATKEVWPFFAIGFCLAAISDLTLIALGAIALAIAFIYINLSENGGNGNGGGGNVGDPLDDILNDY